MSDTLHDPRTIVRAERWDGQLDFEPKPAWLRLAKHRGEIQFDPSSPSPIMNLIVTSDANYGKVRPGDWLVLDKDGIRSVPASEFAATYTPAGQDDEPANDVTETLQQLLGARKAGGLEIVTLAMVEERSRTARPQRSAVYVKRASNV